MSKSVVALIVRKGNPKDIHAWDDLLKPGVKVLTPNPFTSGAAKWNILAAYGATSGGGKDPQTGLAYLRELLTRHVTVQDKSGREALQDFASGNGDVLISYENEAITAQKKGQQVDYVIPDQTILIENPIAVVAKSKHPEQAKAFVDYALSPAAQQKFADWGYRPVDEAVCEEEQGEVPDPERAVHHPRPRRLEQGQRRVLRSRQGLGGRDRAGRGGLHCQVRRSPPVAPVVGSAREDGPTPPARARSGWGWRRCG